MLLLVIFSITVSSADWPFQCFYMHSWIYFRLERNQLLLLYWLFISHQLSIKDQFGRIFFTISHKYYIITFILGGKWWKLLWWNIKRMLYNKYIHRDTCCSGWCMADGLEWTHHNNKNMYTSCILYTCIEALYQFVRLGNVAPRNAHDAAKL